MNSDDVLSILRSREAELRQQGVKHAALFGSVARNEQREDSDIDILVDLDSSVVATMFDYAGIKQFVAELFEAEVDVIDVEALKPRARTHALADAKYAF